MRSILLSLVAALGFTASAQAEPGIYALTPTIGKPAPDFTANDIEGKEVKISDLKGKIVVLEWNNPDCPFVKKFYDSGEMQKLQGELKVKGATWVTVNSSAVGKQGHLTIDDAKKYVANGKSNTDHYIIDMDGKIGGLYAAKTTPHMFVIDKAGNLAYMGAIDDKPTADKGDIAGAKNYVRNAVEALSTDKKVEVASSQAYGCSVKYKD